MKIKYASALLKDGEELLEELQGIIRAMGSPDSKSIGIRASTWGTRVGQYLKESFGPDSQYYQSEFTVSATRSGMTDAEKVKEIEGSMVRKIELLKAVIKDFELK